MFYGWITWIDTELILNDSFVPKRQVHERVQKMFHRSVSHELFIICITCVSLYTLVRHLCTTQSEETFTGHSWQTALTKLYKNGTTASKATLALDNALYTISRECCCGSWNIFTSGPLSSTLARSVRINKFLIRRINFPSKTGDI